jgi:hypothetical protein
MPTVAQRTRPTGTATPAAGNAEPDESNDREQTDGGSESADTVFVQVDGDFAEWQPLADRIADLVQPQRTTTTENAKAMTGHTGGRGRTAARRRLSAVRDAASA